MKYFDSHAHYYDERFESEMKNSVDEFIGAILKDNVSYIINVGTSPQTSLKAIAQAKKHSNMYTAIGIHPSDCQHLGSSIEKNLLEIENLIKSKENKCVALGEIGLDYHYEDTDKTLQAEYFEEQMRLAKHLGLPVSIHDRDAHGDVLEVIRRHPGVCGVLHSYSGSLEMARELCEMGYFISFSGTVSFTNARRVREVASEIPLDRVLIETDCPYLAPHPLRGTLNHSGNLQYTNRALADALGISEEECAHITERNAKRLFKISN
jgi:TatD DNase family protein